MPLPPHITKLIKLQQILQPTTRIELPQIIVIGPQSSGKSSVLERIIGHDLLPKGEDLVTRCPIVINLRNAGVNYWECNDKENMENGRGNTSELCESSVHSGSSTGNACGSIDSRKKGRNDRVTKEYAVFADSNDVYDLSLVKEELKRRMVVLCGNRKEISSQQIVVTLYLRKTVNITLVDLPGLTKVPVGAQPNEIEQIIDDLNMSYCKNNNSIILAVINGCVDLVNSESLKIARLCDPGYTRTMGVVTKLDLVDDRPSIHAILENTKIKLGLGYVGVINRNTKALYSVSVHEHAKREKGFFRTRFSAFYPRIGTQYLIERVYDTFKDKTKAFLDGLRDTLEIENSRLMELERNDITYFYRIVDEYVHHVCLKLRNEHTAGRLFSNDINLRAYARLADLHVTIEMKNVFLNEAQFMYYMRRKTDHLHVQIVSKIGKVCEAVKTYVESIRNGTELREHAEDEQHDTKGFFGFFSPVRFLTTKEQTNDESIIDNTDPFICVHDNDLRTRVIHGLNEAAVAMLGTQRAKFVQNIEQYFKIQQSYMDVDHPDFNTPMTGHSIFERKKDMLGMSLDLMTAYVNTYYGIIKKEVEHYFVKSIFFYFVDFFRNEFRMAMLRRSDEFRFVCENGEVRERIKENERLLDIIGKD
ncbi:Vacuolar sorting protein VPS1, dynamin [Trachipleistophora hominis]|uniref:Vacuolar sorting protein VPS1, dynamin n=1 Tax=Trachipleistophora hominis TaxID=72359 RepID=L7JWI6_TRAHO|nr:Vacuolar sorting protein VPS1, dynamin [Trachipleistophora hominis]